MSDKAIVYVYDFGEETPRVILEGETLSDALICEYETFPETAMLYYGKDFADDKKVCFLSEQNKKDMALGVGEFSIVFYPHEPMTIALVVGGLLLAIAAATFLKPQVPNIATKSNPESSNNSLSERENQQRIGGLVPEIYGTVLTTPDLIAVPYTVYQGNREVEYSVMCLGRGVYDVDAEKIYDDTTPIQNIAGATVDVFPPFRTVNYYSNVRTVGTSNDRYDDVVWETKRCNAVNGQLLLPPNVGSLKGDTRLFFGSVGSEYSLNYQTVDGSKPDFTQNYNSGDSVVLSNATVSVNQFSVTAAQSAMKFVNTSGTFTIVESAGWLTWGSSGLNLSNGNTLIVSGATNSAYNGTYTISSVSSSTLTVTGDTGSWPSGTSAFQSCSIQFPSRSVNFNGSYTVLTVSSDKLTLTLTSPQQTEWDKLKLYSPDGSSKGNTGNSYNDQGEQLFNNATDVKIALSGSHWTENFIIEGNTINNVICNFTCPNGLYVRQDNQYTNTVTVQVGVKPVDSSGTLVSGYSEQFESLTITGSSESLSAQFATLRFNIYQSWWQAGGLTITNQSNLIAARKAILAVWAENIDPSTPLWITRIRKNDTGDSTHRGDQIIVATYDGTTYGTWGRNWNSTTGDTAVNNPYNLKDQRPIWATLYKETATNSGVIDTNTNQKIHILIDYRSLSDGQVVEYSSTATTPNDYLTLSPNIHQGGGFSRIAVRCRRTSDHNFGSEGQVVDDVKIKDVYSQSGSTLEDFGNVTTVYSKTIGTEGSLALKKRKLNILATRMLRCYDKDGDYIVSNGTKYSGSNPPYLATNRIDHILVNVLRDSLIGNIPSSQIDFTGLYTLTKNISNYFASGDIFTTGSGYPLIVNATQFNYTFDKTDMSVYEMLRLICNVCHITPYPELNKFRFSFESSDMDASLLFNHRNKVPASQTRTVSFGSRESYDGLELNWVNPNRNDVTETYKIPSTGSAINPVKLETGGIRNERQAFRIAWRSFFKMKYQTIVDEFEALPESSLLFRNQRIFSADNTRSDTIDGEIVARSGFVLTLSQPADLSTMTDPYIYLQHKDGTVQALPITQGSDNYHVVFSGTLTNSLVTDPEYYAQTIYQIWGSNDGREKSFLIEERSPTDSGNNKIKALLYDRIFYLADKTTFWFQPLDQNFTDKTPNHRNPIPVGGPVVTNDGTGSGQRGYTFYNASAGGYTKFDSGNPLNLAAEFTLMAWIKPNTGLSTGVDFHIFSSTNATSFRFCISRGSSTYSLKAIRGASSDEVCSGLLANPTDWNHVAVAYNVTAVDGSGNPTTGRLVLYLNGVQLTVLTSVTHHGGNSLYFGGNGSSGGWIGRIDGAMVFYDTLSPSTIRSIYNATRQLTGSNKY